MKRTVTVTVKVEADSDTEAVEAVVAMIEKHSNFPVPLNVVCQGEVVVLFGENNIPHSISQCARRILRYILSPSKTLEDD